MPFRFRTSRHKSGLRIAERDGKARVLYDGLCPLCRRTKRIVDSLDWLSRIQWIDFRVFADESQLEQVFGARVDLSAAQREMLVLYRGRLSGGFFAYRTIAWLIPALWPAAPLLHLPGASWVGRKVCDRVARKRFGLGACGADGRACNRP